MSWDKKGVVQTAKELGCGLWLAVAFGTVVIGMIVAAKEVG